MDESAPEQTRAPVQGRYKTTMDTISFTPFFPFVPGQFYRVEWKRRAESGGAFRMASFCIASPAHETLHIVEIAPSAPTLPTTTLRFYITFSRSMRGQFDRRSLRLADDAGHVVTGAFMEFGQELWSANGRRLTLLFDPGRIKRGVTANRIEGPPFKPGCAYTFSVTLPVSSASQTGSVFTVRFKTSPALREPLNPKLWRLTPPQAGTRAPLVLQFDRVMDKRCWKTPLPCVPRRDSVSQAR